MKTLYGLALAITLASAAQAQTYTYSTLYSFVNKSGGPYSPSSLIIDSDGNLYGTAGGGSFGTLFKVTSKGVGTKLWTFTRAEIGSSEGGISPNISRDSKGNFYGGIYSVSVEGRGQCSGSLFKLTAGKNGSYSYSVVPGGGGVATQIGEVSYSVGGIFWINYYSCIGLGEGDLYETVNGQSTDLWAFTDYNSFWWPPIGNLVLGSTGNVYGVDPGDGGQTTYGYIYEWSPTSGFSVLHTFDGIDGATPNVLRQDASGNLYGTTAGDATDNSGTVFKISSAGTFSVLYTFPTGADGPSGNLTLDSSDNIYGTTANSVFKLTASGVESIIYSGEAGAGLVMDKSGNLYGTTDEGANGLGSVYKLTKK